MMTALKQYGPIRLTVWTIRLRDCQLGYPLPKGTGRQPFVASRTINNHPGLNDNDSSSNENNKNNNPMVATAVKAASFAAAGRTLSCKEG